VVTHEVELINSSGHAVDKFRLCILLEDHGNGFFDIICQDGCIGRWIHVDFLRQLPSSDFTDVGFLPTATPAKSRLACPKHGDPDQVGLRIAQLAGKFGRGEDTYELPPSGFQRMASSKARGIFAAGAALRAARSSKVQQAAGDGTLPPSLLSPGLPSQKTEQRSGSSICPFMEIQEGGLRAMVGECSLTSRDVVFDLGCGQGKILNRLLQAFPCRGVGVEVNPQLGRVAVQRFEKYGNRAKVVIDDVRNVDFSEATALVAFFLSHSYEAAGASLKEHLVQSLKPGCVVYNYCYPILGWCGSYNNGVHKYVIGQHLDPEAG